MNELKPEAALREVSIEAIPVSDDDELEMLLDSMNQEQKTIAKITNISSISPDNLDTFSGDWLLDSDQASHTEIIADRDRLKQELEDLRSQHEFECAYVDQLEHEIIGISNDREQQVAALTVQLDTAHSAKLDQLKLDHSFLGLENEYVSDLTRVQNLEQQIEELQEQVLQQAAKAAEYEAAIQHWKEQSLRHQLHALQLSGALDRLLAEKLVKQSSQITSQLTSSQQQPESLSPESIPVRSLHPNSKVDLPAFLTRSR